MTYRPIPEGAVEIQVGLWLESYYLTVVNPPRLVRKLYSADGYCFYDKTTEVYDEEGNLVPEEEIQPNQRLYMQYMVIPESKNIDDLVSVPVDPSYEIV